ncbi:MAG: hypothetical protein COA47_00340 [Robiginitomaculum sp.]|nr:MAG: hypothetical protein COA47_00340 [Robiginitomaculum sp.]
MLSKILALLLVGFLATQPNTPTGNGNTAQAAPAIAKWAAMTTCIGPMTLQALPENRGLLLITFGAGGCSAQPTYGFGLRFGPTLQQALPQTLNLDQPPVGQALPQKSFAN